MSIARAAFVQVCCRSVIPATAVATVVIPATVTIPAAALMALATTVVVAITAAIMAVIALIARVMTKVGPVLGAIIAAAYDVTFPVTRGVFTPVPVIPNEIDLLAAGAV